MAFHQFNKFSFLHSSGGLDALMQILVCREKIGWNDKTRKMVVFASDVSTCSQQNQKSYFQLISDDNRGQCILLATA